MKTKLVIDDREMEVEPVSLTYLVDGKEKSELIISIEGKTDRDYLFTKFVREKIKRARRKNG